MICPASSAAAFDPGKLSSPESVVVAPDGTVYWTNFSRNIGRWAPPYTANPERTWATVPDANAQILGLTLDPKRKVLYAGARMSLKIYRVSTTDPTSVNTFAPAEGGVNGLTLGDDGAVYYVDQNAGDVWRVAPDGTKSKVNRTAVSQPNGIAFAPDGWLYVSNYTRPATVTRLRLDGTSMEMMREEFVRLTGNNGDGIAFDKQGNLYVIASGLWKVTPAKVITQVSPTGGQGIEFGAGALSCKDLFYGGGAFNRMTLTVEGMDVPWHRQ